MDSQKKIVINNEITGIALFGCEYTTGTAIPMQDLWKGTY